MNHHNLTNNEEITHHYKELFRLLAECNPHLAALGYEPLHLESGNTEGTEDAADHCCENCSDCDHCCRCKQGDAHEAVQNALSGLAPGEYYILSSDDFNSLIDDLAEMMESIDWLCRNYHAKEHLAKTLIGVASKLDTSAEERATVNRIMQSVNETSDRWDNIELTPFSFE